ncbi:MAG: hypothetical protein DMF56_11860 [Acidobacteria bacterium]|nr:MAG: hypothetical protein DMF56_11860 [Acidobacteriota bacterium]
MKPRAILLCFALAATVFAHAQGLTVTPQQVYVLECQETFVTLQGTNLIGTSSTLVDFTAPGGQVFELEPNTASSTQLVVWIPLEMAYSVGNYSVSVKAIDTNGTRTIGPTILSIVERSANGPPVLSLPEVVVADATSSSGAYVTYDAGGASCNPASGSLFPIGATTVTCSASNGFGTTSGTFSVVVTSTFGGPPILTLPEAVVAEAISPSGANVSFDAGGASCDHASGSAFAMGTTTVTCSMTNSYGTSTGTFLVVVTDTIAPTLSLPSNITSGNPVVSYTVSATDNIDGSITPACSPSSGSTFPPGSTTVQCTATDAHANSTYGSFTVTITAPTLSDCTASQNVYQLNAATSGTVTYTSNVPTTLTEVLTIRSEATGQTVRTLFNGVRGAGSYQDTWDGRNDAGQLVADGAYRYFVTVSASGSSFTWDDGTHYAGTTATQLPYALCRNDNATLVPCDDSSITFDPYVNKPLRVNYCVGSGTPPSCSGTTPLIVIGKAVSGSETDATCTGLNCFLNEFQSGGAHEFLWYGQSITSLFIGTSNRLTVIRRDDTWPRNLTLVYGTAPQLSNLTISWLVFNPAGPSVEEFRINATTFQSRPVTIKGEFKNMAWGSILRTLTTASQSPGQIVLTWNGRADNGAWVAPGVYEATITVTDSAGSSTVIKPLITVRYE